MATFETLTDLDIRMKLSGGRLLVTQGKNGEVIVFSAEQCAALRSILAHMRPSEEVVLQLNGERSIYRG